MTPSQPTEITGLPVLSPTDVVSAFLDALVRQDVEAGMALVGDGVVYRNVSLPPVRGAAALRRLFRRWADLSGTGFEVVVHRIAADAGTVLTERTDVLMLGPLRLQFWVCGTFEVVDGRITLWRDYFDYANMTGALLRGLAGVAVPPLRARLPRRTPF